jgi:hypothetical protein
LFIGVFILNMEIFGKGGREGAMRSI